MGTQIPSQELVVTLSDFPSPTKSSSSVVDGVLTTVTVISFADKILVTITQAGKLAHWAHVPLASAAADPMNPGLLVSDSENGLLPMSHLTATTVLGGTKRDEEVIGQTLATTIASAILMKRPMEERMLVVGMGFEKAAQNLTTRAKFEEVISLVLEVL